MPERAGRSARANNTVLAFDFGLKRIGVAVGEPELGTAHPLPAITDFSRIEKLVDEWQPAALVVGVPFHPDGAEHENTVRARRFGRQLQGRFQLPVHEVDERYTTTEALIDGASDVDAGAAALILDQFLRSLQ